MSSLATSIVECEGKEAKIQELSGRTAKEIQFSLWSLADAVATHGHCNVNKRSPFPLALSSSIGSAREICIGTSDPTHMEQETSCSEALLALESNVDQLEENFAAELAATELRVKKTIASLVQRLGSYEKREKREKKQRDKEKVLVAAYLATATLLNMMSATNVFAWKPAEILSLFLIMARLSLRRK